MFHENLKLYASDYRLLIQVLNTFHHQTEILSMLMLVILLAFSVPPEKTEVKEWQHTGGGMNKKIVRILAIQARICCLKTLGCRIASKKMKYTGIYVSTNDPKDWYR